MEDYFGKDAAVLRTKKLFLFDMDGTVYQENTLFPGALALLREIRANGGQYVFITNNSSKSVKDYITKVNALGIPAGPECFLTSTQATILYLQNEYPGANIYCQGTKSMIDELKDAGIQVIEENGPEIDVALVGFDTELTSDKLRTTCEVLQKPIPYIATNPDLACPVTFGFIPDCGSICQMLENATGRTPKYIGKPEPTMVEIACQRAGFKKEDTVVIGDRLYTDIAVGLNAHVTAICVLTGEATPQQIKKGNIKPTFTFKSVAEICQCLCSKD